MAVNPLTVGTRAARAAIKLSGTSYAVLSLLELIGPATENRNMTVYRVFIGNPPRVLAGDR